MVDDLWLEYLEALRQVEVAVKLVSFWTEETAKATRLTAYFTEDTVRSVRDYTRQSVKPSILRLRDFSERFERG